MLASAVDASQAQSELDALDLEREMIAALEPSIASTRKLEITLDSPSNEPVSRVAYQARVTAEDGTKKLLTVLSEPEDLRGTAFLVTQTREGVGRKWIYAPSARRVIETTPPDGEHSFLSSGFSFAAFGFLRIARRSGVGA